MKDKNLRKILWGFWNRQNRETGGPDFLLNDKWTIPISKGIIAFLFERIDDLERKIIILEKINEHKITKGKS